MPPLSLSALAQAIGARLEGDPDRVVSRPDTLEAADGEAVSFLANPRYAPLLPATRAAAVVVASGFDGAAPGGCALLRASNPDLAFARATRLLVPPPPVPEAGVHPLACVSPGARLGPGVSVGAFAVVEDGAELGPGVAVWPRAYVGHGARLGAGCVLHPGAVLYHGVRLGDRVTVHAGAVIGADGFGYVWNGREHEKSPQVGTVEIGDDVEIGANATVDRARFGATRIGQGTKIDNLVQVAHNARVGRHCGIAAQAGMAGSAELGDGVMVAGQAGVGGHLRVGDRAVLMGQCGVTKDVRPGAVMYGYPARDHRTFLEEQHGLRALGLQRKRNRRPAPAPP